MASSQDQPDPIGDPDHPGAGENAARGDRVTEPAPGLEGARLRRMALGDAMTGLERVAASPSGAAPWRRQVIDALAAVREALDRHIDEVEQPSGLLHRALDTAPRLVPQVEHLRRDHDTLGRAVDDLERWLSTQESPDAGITRRRVMVVLGLLAEHRQRGADLVYDAYAVDIGGG